MSATTNEPPIDVLAIAANNTVRRITNMAVSMLRHDLDPVLKAAVRELLTDSREVGEALDQIEERLSRKVIE